MKQVSIQDLKATLSATIGEAEAGHHIVITRHNEPVAQLIPAHPQNVHRGRNVGTGGLKPAVERGPRLPYLGMLLDDRGDR